MLSEHDPARPQPGDFAQLRAGNSIDARPGDTFVIVEDFPGGEHLVLNRPAGHPHRDDWAAVLVPDEIASLTRVTPEGARTWTPSPGPEPRS